MFYVRQQWSKMAFADYETTGAIVTKMRDTFEVRAPDLSARLAPSLRMGPGFTRTRMYTSKVLQWAKKGNLLKLHK